MGLQANELMIGNIFNAEDDLLCMSCDVKIISISQKEVNWISITESNKGTVQTDNIIDLEPIPLTPEILEKIGSVQGNDKDMWRNSSGVWLTKINNSERFYVQGFLKGHSIRFLHEYQNVVFALTGEELKINLNVEAVNG